MMRAYRAIVALFVMAMSCITAYAAQPLSSTLVEKVHIVDVADVTHLSTSGMNLYLDVENNTCHRLTITSGEVDIMADGKTLATISLRDKVVIKRNSTTVLVPLRFKSNSTFVMGRLIRRMLANDDNITLSYRVRGGVGPFRKNFSDDDVALSLFFDNFVMSETLLQNIEEYTSN